MGIPFSSDASSTLPRSHEGLKNALQPTNRPAAATTTAALASLGAVAVIGGGCYLYRHNRRKNTTTTTLPSAQSPPPPPPLPSFTDGELVTSCTITRLFVHPVKSCGGYEVPPNTLVDVLPRGLRYDREWVVVRRRDNKVMTIRDLPAMRRIIATIEKGDGGTGDSNTIGDGDGEAAVLALSYTALPSSSPTSGDASNSNPLPPILSVKIPIVSRKDRLLQAAAAAAAADGTVGAAADDGRIPITIWAADGSIVDEGRAAADFLTQALAVDTSAAAVTAAGGVEGAPVEEVVVEEYYLGRTASPRDPRLGSSNAHRVLNKGLRIRAQDASSLHILTEESLAWVKETLAEEEAAAAEAKRRRQMLKGSPSSPSSPLKKNGAFDCTAPELYRPNILVSGVPFPQEDRWDTMAITSAASSSSKSGGDCAADGAAAVAAAEIMMNTFRHCDRCAVPTTSLDGIRDKRFQPTNMLRHRHAIAPSTADNPPKGLLGLNVNVVMPAAAATALPNAGAADDAPSLLEEDDETILGTIKVGAVLRITSFRAAPKYLE